MGLHTLDLPLLHRLLHHALPLLLQRLQAPGTLNSRHVSKPTRVINVYEYGKPVFYPGPDVSCRSTDTPGNNPGLSVSDKNFKIQICIGHHHATVWIVKTHEHGGNLEELLGVQTHISSLTTSIPTLVDSCNQS